MTDIDLDAVRAHTITAYPLRNSMGTQLHYLYHCTTCGRATLYQPPPLPCRGSRDEAVAEAERLRATVARVKDAADHPSGIRHWVSPDGVRDGECAVVDVSVLRSILAKPT